MKNFLSVTARISFAMGLAFLSLMIASSFTAIFTRFWPEYIVLVATTIFALLYKFFKSQTPEIRLTYDKLVEKMTPISVDEVLSKNPRQSFFSRAGSFLRFSEEGQDIAEYAVMLAVILVIVVGTIKLIGSNADKTFSAVASSLDTSGKPTP